MKRHLTTTALLLTAVFVTSADARGLLIPTEPDLPPLALLNHHVDVTLEDQVAVTKVEQTFRNHTDRKLEATYIFPVPAGASVRNFSMWVNDRKVKGELLQSNRAKEMYTSIVRQTKNPALLDYIGTDMISLKVYPVPAKGDQKVAISFTSVAKKEHELVEYIYPLKTEKAAVSTMEEFRLTMTLKSQQPIGSIYSPTHDVVINQAGDHEAVVQFEEHGARLDNDFQLFYTTSGQDIGLTALQHRPVEDEDGYMMMLVSPRAELSKDQKVPRDIVFVIDTSGSMMQDKKMDQAKKALQHCLGGLTEDDRFALVNFATTVNSYRDELVKANESQIKHAKGWVADLYAGGGTAIDSALKAALEMQSDDEGRMFTIVFFTDGQPTIGETKTEKILTNVSDKNTDNTRIFTFGLGDDLNAVLIDQLAEKSRAVSSYVRPGQDIEVKVSAFFNKIHHPVLAGLKLTTTGDVRLAEVYPPQLPDLFHGDQLVVLARYKGDGHSAIVLDGKVGMHDKQFVYEVDFKKQADTKPFAEELWARRKVGYLLDQIRVNGEKKELVDEIVRLAKNYGITTPYTSYLIMPDSPVEVASNSTSPTGRVTRGMLPPALASRDGIPANRMKVHEFARRLHNEPGGDVGKKRGAFQDEQLEVAAKELDRKDDDSGFGAGGAAAPAAKEELRQRIARAQSQKATLDKAYSNYRNGNWRGNQIMKQGVDLALCTNNLKCQNQLQATAIRRVNSRNCMEYGGVWIDEGFNNKTKTVVIKAQSDAYFQILARQPKMKDVFQLGNHIVWIAPNGTGLVIDDEDGNEKITDREIEMLFAAK